MGEMIQIAKQKHVKIGAHPSYPDRENFGRLELNIGPEELCESITSQIQRLIDIAKNNENVLMTPEPRVRFREFADHGLRLQLLFWIHRPESRGRTLDAVNTEIYKRFAEHKIIIPYPTMKVLLPNK